MAIGRRRPFGTPVTFLAIVAFTVMTTAPWAIAHVSASTLSDVFLHEAGTTLTAVPPVSAKGAKYSTDALNSSGGNPWLDAGRWVAAPSLTSGYLVELSDLHAWLGLKTAQDNGRAIDLRAGVYRNGVLVAEALQRCVTGLGTNPTEVTVPFPSFTPEVFDGASDILSLRLSVRMGTTETDTPCQSGDRPTRAAGVRVYFDSTERPTHFDIATVAPAASVRINEIESSGGTPDDWVEFYNTGSTAADLSHHIFRDNDNSHTYVFPEGTSIAAGGFLVLDLNTPTTFGLGASDQARLFAPDGTTVLDSYTWTAHSFTTYGRCPDGSGAFRNTTVPTKGTANDCSVPVRLNEIESSGGDPGDWAELYNPLSTPFDLSGIGFRDNDPGHTIYRIPAGTTIAANGFYTLEEAAFGFGLGAADTANLYAPDVTATTVDSYSWTSHAPVTYGRCPDGSGTFGPTSPTTKNAANACGPVLENNVKINEVESSDDPNPDWIEITNIGASDVDIAGWVLKDDDDSHAYTFAAGTTIAAGAYIAVDTLGFGLGGADAARLFRADFSLADSTTWTAHGSPTWGRCPNATGAFGNTAASTKGLANVCPGDAVIWPGGSAVGVADGSSVFGNNMSGLTYDGAGSLPGVLWAVQNNPGKLWRLVWDGTNQIWTPDAGAWASGKSLRFPADVATDNPDAEGVTFAASFSGSVYVSVERNNFVGATARDSILRFDPGTGASGSTLVASKEWNLTTDIALDLGLTPGSNTGLEAVTWVPDAFLTAHGFVEDATGLAYDPAKYPDHGTGLFFAGLEQNGKVYVYALNDDPASTFTRIAVISTGFAGVMALEWDRETANFWAVCDNTCDGKSATLAINPQGHFAVTSVFARPAGFATALNNEGFAVAAEAECVGGTKPVFWADDDNDDGHAIRQGTVTCGSL